MIRKFRSSTDSGTHVIALRNRESGTGIDQIYLTTDAVNPPTEAIDPPLDSCGYRYDSLGNVVTVPGLGARPSRHFAYDGRGRIKGMTSAGSAASYTYGPEGDVIGLEVTSDDTAEIRNDRHFGPSITRATFQTGDPATGVINATETVLERRIPGVPMVRRGFGPGAEVLYSHSDPTGVRRVTNHAGQITQELSYRAFGGVVEDTGLPHGMTSSADGFNFGDHMRPFGVVHVGARIYDPHTARFMQRDPLLITRSATMMNPYAFAWNDPVNFNDYTGLDPECGAGCSGGVDWGDVMTGLIAQEGNHAFWAWQLALQNDPQLTRDLLVNHRADLMRLMAFGRAVREHDAAVQYAALAGYIQETMTQSSFGERLAGELMIGIVVDTYEDATDAVGYGWKHQSVERSVVGGLWTLATVTPAKFIKFPKIARRAYRVARGGIRGTRAFRLSMQAIEVSSAAVRATSARVGASATRVLDIVRRGGCFVAGTPVETPDGPIPIETLEPGDLVLARDDETGEQAYQRVEQVFVRDDVEVLRLELEDANGGISVIETTAEHPFWVEGKDWVEAAQLRSDDLLSTAAGDALTVRVAQATGTTSTVYNLEVDGFHTYFVGDEPVWVHNNTQCPTAVRNTTLSPALKTSPYHPDAVAARIRPPYKANQAHNPRSPSFDPRKTPEPDDAAAVYQTSVRGGTSTTWWGQGAQGWYRYFHDNVGGVHFSGVVEKSMVPVDILRRGRP